MEYSISLHTTTLSDIDFVRAAERHPENCNYVYQWSKDQHIAALANENFAHYIIMQQDEKVGYIILDDVQNSSHSINLRRIVVTRKNAGIGKKALFLIQDIAFGKLNAHRLWLDVFTDNLNAYQLYRKVGFIEEGKLRESYLRNGNYTSQYIMSILESGYRQAAVGRSASPSHFKQT